MKSNGKPESHFSFPSSRRLARYLGESDAVLEIDELACRFFMGAAGLSGDAKAFVAECSKKHGVTVNLAEFDAWQAHLAQRRIVAVYESAERFLNEFRKEHSALHGQVWSERKDGVTLIDHVLANVGQTTEQARKVVGMDLISRFEYYRLVRNWITHDRARSPAKERAGLAALPEYSDANIADLGRLSAPNPPDSLNFDDFLLFSRVTKLVAARLNILGSPSEDSWLSIFDMKPFKPLTKNPERLKNAVAGRLRTEYGLTSEAAERISKNLCDTLA